MPDPTAGTPRRATGGGATGSRAPGPAAVRLDGHAPEDLLGGKAGSLDRLIGWGFPVPPSGAVTADAYRRFVTQREVADTLDRVQAGEDTSPERIDDVFAGAAFADDDAEVIQRVAIDVGEGGRLAVRSSATVEDLARSSFAGQYRSVLDVDPTDADSLLSAVRAVFASLWHPAPRTYRRAFGIDDGAAAMAVVLMRMVPARRAGVLFTADPAGNRAVARIEAVEGLGDSLVSGAETPNAMLVSRDGDRGEIPGEIDEALALGLRIEERYEHPQDIEWAWDGDRVWIVQARPITVAGQDLGDGFDDPLARIEDADLTTAGIGEMLPGVLPPLVWSIDAHMVEEAFRRLLADLGVMPDDVTEPRALLHRVRGRAVMDFSRLRAMAGALPGSAGDHLEAEYFGSRRRGREAAPANPGPLGRMRSALHDLRVLRARRRSAIEVAVFVQAVHEIVDRRPELDALDAPGLLAYQFRLVDVATRGMAAELGIAADATATYRRLQVMLSRHMEPIDAGRLADRAVARAGVTAAVGPDASAAVFAGPTWRELGRTPPEGAGRERADDHREAFDALLDELRAIPGWKSDSIGSRLRVRAMRRLAEEATERLSLREQSKAALLELGGEVRRVHLELGRRLVAAGHLDDPTDVDLLAPAEVRDALLDDVAVPSDVLGHRRRWRASYEQQGPLPPRFSGTPEAIELDVDRKDCVEGWAASAGRYRGVVQVVESPNDELTKGAVMVAEVTDPSWSPLFLEAGAIVLDRGGPLSHAAILAREIGVPAVLNVPGATRVLEGHEVTVDGDSGIVIIHREVDS